LISHYFIKLIAGGKLCTFSPCIEQVQKTVEALKSSGDFIQLRTMEVLQRPMSIHTKTLMSIDFSESVECVSGGKMGPVKKEAKKFRTLVTPPQIAGHTGYLTFATFVPQGNNNQ
jgi:tRNA (adenine57-N1/adenine58-N1)-methyltransferase